MFDKLVYGKLRAALGGRVRWAVSGGAPLGPRLGHFYRGIGLTVLEGYGLTETTAASTVNTPGMIKIGTVGRPLPGVSIRIARRRRDPHQGWTGLRRLLQQRGSDRRGAARRLVLDRRHRRARQGRLPAHHGRKKEIIVTAGGKNVAPAVLEDRLRAHRLVSQCIVVGDAQPYIACLVTLDEEALPAWLEQRGKSAMSPAEAAEDPDVTPRSSSRSTTRTRRCRRPRRSRSSRSSPSTGPRRRGALTPSLKLKRGVVMKEYAAEVDALYS